MPLRAVRVLVEVQEDLRDDLAEAERHDGQVVAAQPQGGRADDDAGPGAGDAADDADDQK